MASSPPHPPPHLPPSLGDRLARAWAALTQPPAHLPEDRRRRARLLNALLIGLLALLTVALAGIYGFGWGAGTSVAVSERQLVLAWPVLLLAYGLNRARWQTLATLLTIAVTGAVAWLLVLSGRSDTLAHPELLFYPVVSIILAALLLPGALAVLIGLMNVLALLAVRELLPAGYDPFGFVVWYVILTALIGLASALHRADLTRLERESQALAEDVLARRQAEAALLESEQRFHNAFEFANIGVALVALDGRWTQVNPALCELTGYTAAELLATTAQAITHPADREVDQYHRDQLYQGAWPSYQLEQRYCHKAGHVVWVLVNASAVRSASGQPLYFVAQLQDITERKRVQAALEDSQQRLTNAFDQAGIGMAWSTLTGEYLTVNHELCALTGYSAAELQGMGFADLTFEDDLADSQALRDRVLAGNFDSYQIEKRYRHKAGHALWVLLTVKLLRDVAGQPLYFFAQVQDMTERHAAVEALRESGERYRAMLEESEHLRQFNASVTDVMAEGLVMEDAAGHITLINPRLHEMLGYTSAELVGRPSLDLIAPDERAAVAQHAQQRPAGITSRYETRLVTRAGRDVPALISATPLTKDGVFTGTLATIIDISDRKAGEELLREANAKLRGWLTDAEQRSRESALLNELNDLLQTCLTPEEAYAVMTPLLGPLFPGDAGRLYIIPGLGEPASVAAQWGPPGAAGSTIFDQLNCWALRRSRVHAVDLERSAARRASALVCSHVAQPWPAAYVCVPMTAQGETLGVLHLSRLRASAASDARPIAVAAWLEGRQQLARTVADSLALALANLRLRDRLRDQSIRDPLTSLFNRRYLEETLERELHRARREERPVGMIMVDIDSFKSFNDTLGHDAGDHVLREVGHLLRSSTRGEDIVCRLGGEEFTLLLPGAGLAAAYERAERLRAAVEALETNYRGQPLRRVTISAGVAICPAHGQTGEAVLRAADEAMYAAKRAGRNCVRVAGSREVAAA